MRLIVLSIILLSASAMVASLAPCKSLTEEDKKRFLSLFEYTLSTQPDPATWRYSALGFQLLRPNTFPMAEKACQFFGRALTSASEKPLDNVQIIFHALDGTNILAKTECAKTATSTWPSQDKLGEISKQLSAAITSGDAASSAEKLYYVVASLKALKAPIDSAAVHALVQKLLKKDSTAVTQSFIFHTVVLLNLEKDKLKSHFNDIEDVIQQADETEGAYLYYESGLFTTAFMVDAIYKLAEKYGEVPKISEDKMLKLSNYLLSRRYVGESQGAAYLILALHTLANNQRIVPVCIAPHGLAQVTASSKSQPLRFTATDVLGRPIDLSLKAVSVVDVKTKNVVGKGPLDLTKDSTKGLYDLSLAKLPLTRGQYVVTFGGPTPTETKTVHYVGVTGTSLAFKVVAEKVNVGPVKLFVGEAEGSSGSEATRGASTTHVLQNVGQSLESPVALDSHVKLRIAIPVSDASERVPEGSTFRPHQCFLRLYHDQTGREIILVATPNTKTPGALQLVVDPSVQFKDFGYLSGAYTLDLLVGDALMPEGIRWTLGKAVITFPPAPVSPPSAPSADVHWADAPRLPGQVAKPEIQHMFRPADKRASAPISTLFTILCILPLGLLLTLWGKLGANLRGLAESSPAAIGFHACLAGFFVLYYFYWTRWNMFATLGFVTLLGLPTFLCGNMMLRSIAAKRLQDKKSIDNQ
jgi:oligosaccharyltransferase complex subunit delta (ribophorin II)